MIIGSLAARSHRLLAPRHNALQRGHVGQACRANNGPNPLFTFHAASSSLLPFFPIVCGCLSVCLYVCVRARTCVSTEQCTPLDATMWLCLVFFYLFWTWPLNRAALPLCLLVRDE